MSSPLLLAALPRLAGSSGLAGSSAGAVWTLAADLAALPLLGLSLGSSCIPTGQLHTGSGCWEPCPIVTYLGSLLIVGMPRQSCTCMAVGASFSAGRLLALLAGFLAAFSAAAGACSGIAAPSSSSSCCCCCCCKVAGAGSSMHTPPYIRASFTKWEGQPCPQSRIWSSTCS